MRDADERSSDGGTPSRPEGVVTGLDVAEVEQRIMPSGLFRIVLQRFDTPLSIPMMSS